MSKVIGLIGGMSWESSIAYYRMINELMREKLGGQNNAKSLMYTVNFHDIELMQREARWDDAAAELADAAQRLERGGADFIILCTNTMHKVAPAIERAVKIPLIHIASATGDRIKAAGLKRVGLLATRFTMEQDFYKDKLIRDYGLDVLVPEQAERDEVHRIIYDELCLGKVLEPSRNTYKQIMESLRLKGAEAIILGCTEITLLVKPGDTSLPTFDTTLIHAQKAVELALMPMSIA